MKSLHVLRYGEIMRRDFVVLILIFSMHLEGALRALVGFQAGFHVVLVSRWFLVGLC